MNRFAVVVNCMDGRVQEAVIDYVRAMVALFMWI